MSPEETNARLLQSVVAHDTQAVESWLRMGADPFAPAGPVDLYVAREGWSVKLANGSAAAAAIQWPDMLNQLLPSQMPGWPVVTKAADVWGVVSKNGQDVNLAQWAVEMGAMASLRMLISRLDRSLPESSLALNRLTLSCLGGCSHQGAKDHVLHALILCMAAKPELERGWSHWRTWRLPSQGVHHEHVLMPMTFVMAAMTKTKGGEGPFTADALEALSWSLAHDECVRDGHRRMGNSADDTLMHMAAAAGNLDVLRIALDQGCALDVLDGHGLTPLALAFKRGQFDAAAVIESRLSNAALERALADAGQEAATSCSRFVGPTMSQRFS